VIVGIDDASLAELNERWPWPRRLHARLIETLHDAGAAVIAMDVIFDHPTTPRDDAALERAVAKARNVVLAASQFSQETAQGMLWSRFDPMPSLVSAGAKPGLVNIQFESDQVVRRFPEAGESFWKEVLFRVREAVPTIEFDSGLKSDDLMRFVGPDHSFPYVSYYRALDVGKSVPKDLFENALVLVGRETQAAADIGSAQVDVFATPFTSTTGRLTPGVEILATFIDNAVNRSSIREIPLWGRGIILLAVSLWCAMVPWHFRPVWSALSALLACVAVAAASAALFVHSSWWLPVFSTIAIASGIYVIQGSFAYVVELRNKARIREAFSLFVPAAVADSMAEQSTALEPGGEEKELTVLFTDLAGFKIGRAHV
jgi:adenylate cyclase